MIIFKELTYDRLFNSSIELAATAIYFSLQNLNKKSLKDFIYITLNCIVFSVLEKNISKTFLRKKKNINENSDGEEDRPLSSPFLPPISLGYKYTLVLDLDETLEHFFISGIEDNNIYAINSSIQKQREYIEDNLEQNNEEENMKNKCNEGENNEFKLSEEISENKYNEFYDEYLSRGMFLVRPFTHFFLEELNQYYELVIFTASKKDYCDMVIDVLDPEGKFIKHKLYREHVTKRQGEDNIKDLSLLGRDMNKILIVDNLPLNYELQKNNGIEVPTWMNDINDTTLRDLALILKEIVKRKIHDVRKVVKRIKKITNKQNKLNYGKIDIEVLFS